MLLRKPLFVATLATVVAAAALSPKAQAADPLLGALIGGGIGAAIGHDANRHHGAAVGGAIGALVGAGIASAENDRYYGDPYYRGGYYSAPAPAYGYYAPPPPVYSYSYYAPPPVYAVPSVVIGYSSYPRHYRYSGHRHYHRGY
jgi:hypothetical protein